MIRTSEQTPAVPFLACSGAGNERNTFWHWIGLSHGCYISVLGRSASRRRTGCIWRGVGHTSKIEHVGRGGVHTNGGLNRGLSRGSSSSECQSGNGEEDEDLEHFVFGSIASECGLFEWEVGCRRWGTAKVWWAGIWKGWGCEDPFIELQDPSSSSARSVNTVYIRRKYPDKMVLLQTFTYFRAVFAEQRLKMIFRPLVDQRLAYPQILLG